MELNTTGKYQYKYVIRTHKVASLLLKISRSSELDFPI